MRPARAFPVVLLLLIASAALPVESAPAQIQAQAEDPPNILIFVTDDQRGPGSIGVMDAVESIFAQGGTNLRQGYANTPLCCPSRATIMTGRMAHNHGVRHNGEAHRLTHYSTLQRYLKDAGYRTGIYGKFLNRWDLTRWPPYFDRWAVFNPTGYYKQQFNSNGNMITVNKYVTDFLKSRVSTFLTGAEANDAQPWMLMMTPNAPHTPFVPAPRHLSAPVGSFPGNPAVYESDRRDKPSFVEKQFMTLGQAKSNRSKQLRMLMSVDDLVAETFEQLGRFGELDNTLAFYVSDNGYLWREHGLGGKTLPYTHSIRVPFYVWGPGLGVPQGVANDQPVTLADITPTVLAVAGIPQDPAFPIDGRPMTVGFSRDRVFTEFTQEKAPSPTITPPWASLRTASYQYVEYYATDGFTVIAREYYDLIADPWQNTNLLGDADLSNDPDVTAISAQLRRDRMCRGSSGETACP